MVGQLDIFDFTNDKSGKPIKSSDWKWSFKDYPQKNGLKAFSCFACGGGVAPWDINYLVLM